jgi:hypothetical protein
MKFDDDRQRSSNLHMSSGDSLVLELRVLTAASLTLMTTMLSFIGTDGNKASASNNMRSSGPRVRVLMWETNWVEFLQVKGLFSMYGLRRVLR